MLTFESNSSCKSVGKKLILVFIPSLFIGLNIFFYTPATIFSSNTSEFLVCFSNILRYYVWPFFILISACLLGAVFFQKKGFERYVSFLFAVGLLVWLQANVLVWKYGALNGIPIVWDKYKWQGRIDGVLWFICLWFSILMGKRVAKAKIIVVASLAFIFSQATVVTWKIVKEPESFIGSRPIGSSPPKRIFKYSPFKNIIHILLDSMQTDVFQEVVEEDGLTNDFDGFILFPENMGVFGTTAFTLPAIFSGEIYRDGTDVRKYIEKAMSKDSFFAVLKTHGYEINVIPGIEIPTRNVSCYYMVPRTYGGSESDKRMEQAALLMDLVLFRCLPQLLKKIIYNNQKWTIQPYFVRNYTVGYYYYKSFFKDYISKITVKSAQPTYHFIHLLPPHPPYVTLSDCSYAGRALPPTRDNYKTEVKCILELFCEFLDKIKALGIYDSSLIILQGDTGTGFPVNNLIGSPSSCTGRPRISPATIGRALALLAIKPPNSRGPMKISLAKTTVSDIPSTILKSVGLSRSMKGLSVLELDPGKRRERVYNNQYEVIGSVYDVSSWKKINKKGSLVFHGLAKYRWGSVIEFGYMGNSKSYQEAGWSLPEDGLTWIDGKRASMKIPTPPANGPILMRVKVKPLLFQGKVGRQLLNVFVNGHQVGNWAIERPGFQEGCFVIPQHLIRSSERMYVMFEVPNAVSQKSLGVSLDQRVLGVAFKSITLFELRRLEPGESLHFGMGGNASQYQAKGWSIPERGFTWTEGQKATLVIPLRGPKASLRLKAVIRPFLASGRMDIQIVHVLANGREAGMWKLAKPGFSELTLELPKRLFSDSNVLMLSFYMPKATSPARLGISTDSRTLGIAVKSISLVKE